MNQFNSSRLRLLDDLRERPNPMLFVGSLSEIAYLVLDAVAVIMLHQI